jgi:ubiquitin carboxyl-terminal hydrolase L5
LLSLFILLINFPYPIRPQFENALRKHNHLGLLHALLLALAKAGKLDDAKEGARGVMRERRNEREGGVNM